MWRRGPGRSVAGHEGSPCRGRRRRGGPERRGRRSRLAFPRPDRRRAGRCVPVPADARLRPVGTVRLRRRPVLVHRAEVHRRRALRQPLRRLRIRARPFRRDGGLGERHEQRGGWDQRPGGRRAGTRVRARLQQLAGGALQPDGRVPEPVRRVRRGAGAARPRHRRRARAARRRALRGRQRQQPCAALPSRPGRAPGPPAGGLRVLRHRARAVQLRRGRGRSTRRATTTCSSPTTATNRMQRFSADGVFGTIFGAGHS